MIVVNQLPETEQNAIMFIFSAKAEQRAFGATTYQPRSPEGSSFLLRVFSHYREEMLMPYTWEEMVRETRAELFATATVAELLKGKSSAELLAGLSSEMRVELLRQLQAESSPTPPKPNAPA